MAKVIELYSSSRNLPPKVTSTKAGGDGGVKADAARASNTETITAKYRKMNKELLP